MFESLPWYGYILLIIGVGSYVMRHLGYFKEGYEEPDLKKAKFKKDENSSLNESQRFALALDSVTNEWWEVNTNTLFFKTGIHANNYLEGWGIDTPEGYWGLTKYFIEDGRRWYFDFIYNMIKNEPEEKWPELMAAKYGENERAERYLNLLSTQKAQGVIKGKGFITFDSEFDLGVAAYDASVLVGHARRAFTAKIISEQEAWEVINFAKELAIRNFSSWEEFGKSYVLGFTLDIRDRNDGFKEEMYHLYSQVLENPDSPWNTIQWHSTVKS